MPALEPYAYALWRVVPDVERGEALNAGVVLFCRRHRFLAARVALDRDRFRAFAPGLDVREVADHLDGLVRVAAGARDAGPVAALPASERFGWLVAPTSTVVQPGPVHTGLCQAPADVLARLCARLVSSPGHLARGGR